MKTALMCLILLMASTVRAQDRIDLYADLGRSSCEITDQSAFALVRVYVFLDGPVLSTGVRFKAPIPACWKGATWVGDSLPDANHAAIGDSQSDWTVAFSSQTGSLT